MAHPVIWPNKIFFYPIGNTPAVCFTSDLRPEQAADILLLGCGDARSILYTVFADLGAPLRNLDFTCCDWEPAILARNVLLYTLVADLPPVNVDRQISKIWNFYYHFFIDKDTLDMLLSHCQRLVDISADASTWNSSKYGRFLRFCTSDTLDALRRHWMLYIESERLPKATEDMLYDKFHEYGTTSNFERRFPLTSNRSAGPLWMELKDVGAKQFDRYWSTGVTFDDPNDVAAANLINPTFAYSAMGLGFELHYGSDPLLSFHLARALAPIKGNRSTQPVTISSLVESAMAEFKGWCQTFSKRLKAQSARLVIRFFVGDALAFCRALHCCAVNDVLNTGVYAMPWSSTLISLVEGDYAKRASRRAPLQFNVIDTSNLADHLGLLHVLIACKPLMQRNPSSILHTNTLLPYGGGGAASDGFRERMCGDIPILSMLLDMIPTSYVSNFTSHSNMHEKIMHIFGHASGMTPHNALRNSQLQEQISWRIGSLSDSEIVHEASCTEQRLEFDEKQLATFLYNVYLNLFADENIRAMFQSSSLWKFSQIHYVRFSFAYLLRTVKDRVRIDWETFINHLHDLISYDDKLLVGSNNFQDMICAFHLLDVYSFTPFSRGFDGSLGLEGPLKGWKDIPPVVCISLQMPRERLKPLENIGWQELGTSFLICSIAGGATHNYFQHYQSFFGRVRASYHCDPAREPSVTFDEDRDGIRSSSPAVFTFYVPTWLLRIEPSLQVVVSIRATPFVATKLGPVLGASLDLFSAGITNRKYVHITRERPGNPGELQKLRNMSFAQPVSPGLLSDVVKISLDIDCKRVAALTGRAHIVDAKMKAALANNDTIEIRQISSHAVRVLSGEHRQVILYPFPINSTNLKSRIAGESPHIEVNVNVFNPAQKFGMPLNPLPIVKYNGALNLWNVHYIDFDRLPGLALSGGQKLDFVAPHVAMAFSDRELQLCKAEAKAIMRGPELDVFTRVKQSIHDMFVHASGLSGKPLRVIALTDPDNGGIYTFIFVNSMRLDLASHTTVLDAVVFPLTPDLVMRLSRSIWQISDGNILQIKTRPDEVKAWKHLLPAFAERCRRWKHAAHCEYLSKGIPLSQEMDQSPICSCGKGKNLGPFAQNKEWKPFVPHCTRIAISPLFAVSFFDTAGEYQHPKKLMGQYQPYLCICLSVGLFFLLFFYFLLKVSQFIFSVAFSILSFFFEVSLFACCSLLFSFIL